MQVYEIRLVRQNGQTVQNGPTILSSRYISDYAALRSARAMASPEDGVEIWRGMECIYRNAPRAGR